MMTPFLQSYYRRDANPLTPEQIEEIRVRKNKVPIYTIIRDYHIRKERVLDIWNNCERYQQGGSFDIVDNNTNMGIQTTNHNMHDIELPAVSSDKQSKRGKSRSKPVRISDPVNKAGTTNDSIKKVGGDDDLQAKLIQNRKEIEEAKRETKRILDSN